jgi:ribonuclease HI
MLRTTPIGPLVKEASLRSADLLLENRQQRYATCAFELPHGNPIGEGVRNPLHPVSLCAKLLQCATHDIRPQFSGQDIVETTFIPIYPERILVPVLIESREKPEQTAFSTKEPQIRCIWTEGSRDDLGNVGAAFSWTDGTNWTGLKYGLARNTEVFKAELFPLLQATIINRDEVEAMITEGVQKLIILPDSQAVLNRNKQNGPGPGQTWASAIIQTTEAICKLNIQLQFWWVPGHADIEGNKTVDCFAKDAAAPENEEELLSEEDRCTSMSHLGRCTTDDK